MHSLGVVYTLAVVILGAIMNYLTWSNDGELTNSLFLLLFVILYFPLLFFYPIRKLEGERVRVCFEWYGGSAGRSHGSGDHLRLFRFNMVCRRLAILSS